jgi:hypothetical protein
MSDAAIETTRELCDDIDDLLELARQKRAPIRAVLGLSGKE